MAGLIHQIKDSLSESLSTLEKIANSEALQADLAEVTGVWVRQLKAGNKILFAGNGGSAGDSQHMAGELVSRFYYDRPGLPGIALTVDTSVLTAIGNDYGFERIFVRQLEALARPGDIFVAISTSGNSANILAALEYCKMANIITLGMTGETGGKMADACDYVLKIPSQSTPRIQEGHIVCGHILCELTEAAIFPRTGLDG